MLESIKSYFFKDFSPIEHSDYEALCRLPHRSYVSYALPSMQVDSLSLINLPFTFLQRHGNPLLCEFCSFILAKGKKNV